MGAIKTKSGDIVIRSKNKLVSNKEKNSIGFPYFYASNDKFLAEKNISNANRIGQNKIKVRLLKICMNKKVNKMYNVIKFNQKVERFWL